MVHLFMLFILEWREMDNEQLKKQIVAVNATMKRKKKKCLSLGNKAHPLSLGAEKGH